MAIVTLGDQKTWMDQAMEARRYQYDDVKKGDVIVDVGAYQGEFSDEFLSRYQGLALRFILFEPTNAILKGRPQLSTPYFEIIQAAASDRDGMISLGGEHNWVGYFESDHQRWYQCVDIARALAHEPEIFLCKINIEGMEYSLLTHMIDTGLISRIKHLQVQFHFVEGENSTGYYDRIADALSKTHEISWRHRFVWESWQRKPENL